MANYAASWGLDIGETSVKAVKLVRDGDTANVAAYAVEPIARGRVGENGEVDENYDRNTAVIDALKQLVGQYDLAGEPVIASLSGRQVFSKSLNLPILDEKKLHRMVELEARQQIPGDFDEVLWDYHTSPSALDDGTYDVALFAARQDIISDLLVQTKAAGINVLGVSVTALAVYNFVNFDQEFEDDESVIVLDVGAENTDLVVYNADSIWMRNLSVSGNNITNAFMKKFRVSFDEAEKLKQQVDDTQQSDRILRVIEGSLGELAGDIQRSLGFYKSINKDAHFENVVVCGNTFKLGVLAEFLADRLGYPIIALVELDRLTFEPHLDRGHFLNELQGMSTALGLALQGVGCARADVNLLPKDQQIQQILKTKRWAAVALLVIIALSFIVSFAIKQSRITEYYENGEMIKSHSEDLRIAANTASDLYTGIQPLLGDLAEYDDFGRHRGLTQSVQSTVLAAIANVALDESTWLAEDGRSLEAGGDPVRQSVYIESITIPPYDIRKYGFNPAEEQRTVKVQVRCSGVNDQRRRTIDRVMQELKALSVDTELAQITGLSTSSPLFTEVMSKETTLLEDEWMYVDEQNLNTDGDIEPRVETRTFTVEVFTLECALQVYVKPVVIATSDEGEEL